MSLTLGGVWEGIPKEREDRIGDERFVSGRVSGSYVSVIDVQVDP
jgi:hypothetical protein